MVWSHNTGGSSTGVTTIDFGQRYYASIVWIHDDVVTDYFNYGYSSNDFGAAAILGEMYYRNGGGRRFNIRQDQQKCQKRVWK